MSYIVESDNQLVVRAVSSSTPIYSPFRGIIDDCRGLLTSMNNVNIVFVKLSGKNAANWLVRHSSSNPGCIIRAGFVSLYFGR